MAILRFFRSVISAWGTSGKIAKLVYRQSTSWLNRSQAKAIRSGAASRDFFGTA